MITHLVTRVNLKYDPNFVFWEHRMLLLTWRVADAVREQSDKNFKWVGLIDEWTSPKEKKIFYTLFDEVYEWKKSGAYSRYLENYKWQEVLSIRLDSDDIIMSDYVKIIKANVDKTEKIMMVVANKGIDVDQESETVKFITIQVDYPIWFFGVYEQQLKKWCYEKSHTEMKYPTLYISDVYPDPLWYRVIHWENRGSKRLLFKYRIDDSL